MDPSWSSRMVCLSNMAVSASILSRRVLLCNVFSTRKENTWTDVNVKKICTLLLYRYFCFETQKWNKFPWQFILIFLFCQKFTLYSHLLFCTDFTLNLIVCTLSAPAQIHNLHNHSWHEKFHWLWQLELRIHLGRKNCYRIRWIEDTIGYYCVVVHFPGITVMRQE